VLLLLHELDDEQQLFPLDKFERALSEFDAIKARKKG